MTARAVKLAYHLEPVMGTIVAITGPDPLLPAGVSAAVAALHHADRTFSTWNPDSPMSRLRSGEVGLDHLDPVDAALITEVLDRCRLARELTSGAFDPWAMPGGVDPTGLVKGWAAERARRALTRHGAATVMINAGGDIGVAGRLEGQPWRIGIRHPGQPHGYSAVVEVTDAIATSGDYERPGQLIDPATGRTARVAASATVTGPELDLADALATGLAVGGGPVLAAIDGLPGYEAYLITDRGHHYATPGMAFSTIPGPTGDRSADEDYGDPARPTRLPSGSVKWPTTSPVGARTGPNVRVAPRRSASRSAASTSGTLT